MGQPQKPGKRIVTRRQYVESRARKTVFGMGIAGGCMFGSVGLLLTLLSLFYAIVSVASVFTALLHGKPVAPQEWLTAILDCSRLRDLRHRHVPPGYGRGEERRTCRKRGGCDSPHAGQCRPDAGDAKPDTRLSGTNAGTTGPSSAPYPVRQPHAAGTTCPPRRQSGMSIFSFDRQNRRSDKPRPDMSRDLPLQPVVYMSLYVTGARQGNINPCPPYPLLCPLGSGLRL